MIRVHSTGETLAGALSDTNVDTFVRRRNEVLTALLFVEDDAASSVWPADAGSGFGNALGVAYYFQRTAVADTYELHITNSTAVDKSVRFAILAIGPVDEAAGSLFPGI